VFSLRFRAAKGSAKGEVKS